MIRHYNSYSNALKMMFIISIQIFFTAFKLQKEEKKKKVVTQEQQLFCFFPIPVDRAKVPFELRSPSILIPF